MWRVVLALALVQGVHGSSQMTDQQQREFDARVWYGKSIAGLGDVDGDGSGDFAVSAPCARPDAYVELRSGRTRKVLWKVYGRSSFGWKILGAGDVDRDGTADLVSNYANGAFAVLSGCDGARIFEAHGRSYRGSHGATLNGPVDAGVDVDADGVADVLIDTAFGAAIPWSGYPAHGALIACGFDGHVLGLLKRLESLDIAAFAGDLDADGQPDVLTWHRPRFASAPARTMTIRMASAAAAAELWRAELAVCPDPETALCRMDDVDGDTILDYAVGATCRSNAHPGAVHVLSGRTGAALHWVSQGKGSTLFGYSLASTPDSDGDGVGDLLVGEYEGLFRNESMTSGRVHLVSGLTGAIVWSSPDPHPRASESWEDFGASVASIGDVDGDSVPDLAVGAMNDYEGAFYPGAVHVFSGRSGAWIDSLP